MHNFNFYNPANLFFGARTVLELGGIEANPSYATMIGVIAVVRREKIDGLLAVNAERQWRGRCIRARASSSKHPASRPVCRTTGLIAQRSSPIAQLEAHVMIALGEQRDVTLEVSRSMREAML